MKPQYTKGKWKPVEDKTQSGFWMITSHPRMIEAEMLSKDNAQLICSSVNIIQSLADSLGVNAVELAQRMEEGKLILKMKSIVEDVSDGSDSLEMGLSRSDAQETLSKLEGRQG